mgnify:CR=1 FL=1
MLYVAPTAPHRSSTDGATWYPPTPPKRYANLYQGENVSTTAYVVAAGMRSVRCMRSKCRRRHAINCLDAHVRMRCLPHLLGRAVADPHSHALELELHPFSWARDSIAPNPFTRPVPNTYATYTPSTTIAMPMRLPPTAPPAHSSRPRARQTSACATRPCLARAPRAWTRRLEPTWMNCSWRGCGRCGPWTTWSATWVS